MSGPAMKWALGQTIAHAGLTHLVSVLAQVADKNGCSWRAQATLAEQMALSERCIRQRLAALQTLGIIQRAHRSNGAGGRSSDLIRLRLDRQFTITKATAQAVLQAANFAGSKRSSNRQISASQPAGFAGDKGSDQQKVEIYQEPLSLEVGNTREASAGPTLRIVSGGRS